MIELIGLALLSMACADEPHLQNIVFFNKDYRYDNQLHQVYVFEGNNPTYYFFQTARFPGWSLFNDLPFIVESASSRLVSIDGGKFSFVGGAKRYFSDGERPRKITMFRHPVQHVLASYSLCKFGRAVVESESVRSIRPLNHYLAYFDNVSSPPDEVKLPPYACFNPVNAQSRGMEGHSITELFTFGIQEYYRESMCLINFAITGQIAPYCKCGTRASFLRPSRRLPRIVPSRQELVMIAHLIKKDRQLYREARLLFFKRIWDLELLSGLQIFCPRVAKGSADIVWNSPGDKIRMLDLPVELLERDEIVVYLDHGGFTWHEDVFYAVADLAYRMLGKPNILFLIDTFFAELNNGGFEDFLAKYSTMGSIPNFKYKLVKVGEVTERPIFNMCSDFDSVKKTLRYDYRFVVTTSLDDPDYRDNATAWKVCMDKYKNSESDFFCLHNIREGGIERVIIEEDWNNYIAVSNIDIHKAKYSFLPSAIPVPQELPDCSRPPAFIIHGRLGKKYLSELEIILNHRPKFNVTIRAMSNPEYRWNRRKKRHELKPLPKYLQDERMDIRLGSEMIPFNEAHIGCAFILPLIDPRQDKVGYFTGQTSSSIGVGFHYRLRFVVHEALAKMYERDLAALESHFLHDGSPLSVIGNFQRAINSFQSWCTVPNKKKQWWPTH